MRLDDLKEELIALENKSGHEIDSEFESHMPSGVELANRA